MARAATAGAACPEGAPPASAAALWALVWPLALTMSLNAVTGLVDAAVAGRSGAVAQAAAGLSVSIVFLINSAAMALSIGAQALVSRFTGARDPEGAARATAQTLRLGVLLGLAVLPPLYFGMPALFGALGAGPEVQAAGVRLMRWNLAGVVPAMLGVLCNAAFRARGESRLVLANNAVENVVWGAISLGLGGLAGWGLPGLALGFVAGKTAGFLMAWRDLMRGALGAAVLARLREPLERAWAWRILKVGVPAGVQSVARNLGGLAYFTILGWLPEATAAIAAASVGMRTEALAFLPVFALNIAAATVVGQWLGAGDPAMAERVARRLARAAVAAMAGFGLFFFVAADALAGAMAPDPEVARLAAGYLRTVAVCEPALAVTMVFTGAMQGAGETRVPMLTTIALQIGVRIPMAWALSGPAGLGPEGAWLAMGGSYLLQALVVTYVFTRGSWRAQRV